VHPRLLTLAATFAVAIGAFAPSGARADVVRLTSGGAVRGEVVSETRTEVVVRAAGGTTVIPRHEVESIERGRPGDRVADASGLEAEYQARLAGIDPRDPEARYALGLWLKAMRADALARREFEAVIALDPAHRFARDELAREEATGRAAAGVSAPPALGLEVVTALDVVRAGEPAPALEAAWRTLDQGLGDPASRGLIEAALVDLERDARRGVERAHRRASALTGRYDPQAGPDGVRARTLARHAAACEAALAAVFADATSDVVRHDVVALVAQARAAHTGLDALLRRDARGLVELTPAEAVGLARALGPDRERALALRQALAGRGLVDASTTLPAAAPALRALVAACAAERPDGLAGWDRALAGRVRDERVIARNAAVARAAAPASRPTPDELEQVRLTNEHRLALGRPALELDLRLVTSARGHAGDMASQGFFDHASPSPGRATPGERMAAAGYAHAGGENIARGVESARAAHDLWVASPAHHRNLLDAGWRAIGVGRDGRLWTQNFGVAAGE
jgi:hypothetical protein